MKTRRRFIDPQTAIHQRLPTGDKPIAITSRYRLLLVFPVMMMPIGTEKPSGEINEY